MNHTDHVRLLAKGVTTQPNQVWADIGSGTGAFTLALRDLLGEQSEIYSVDVTNHSLQTQKEAFAKQFPHSTVHFLTQDFTHALTVPLLDGIVAANAIHFQKQTIEILKHLKQYLQPQGRLLIVEYNVDVGNMWVPYPFSFSTLKTLGKQAGFTQIELLETEPSQFLHEIYSALLQ